ncbi:helix-turn-helix domain-containing protein [Halomarina salina]|uniref:Helix-turn-helix domain-containing protein n=1 Tax=Halomarina salina TaxID=1872699 RepID=A0ABD5RJH3_9EURY|nr:helix-turn-helix domain-containing protein [Halomarina salina]
MILVEFTLDHPILREALRSAPETRLVWEQSHRLDDGGQHVVVWAEGADVDAFEDALDGDPSVTEFDCAAETGQRRLYQIVLSAESTSMSVYPALVEEASIIEHLSASSEGWQFRVAFPGRDSLDEFRDFCEEHDLRYEVSRIYEQPGGPDDDHRTFGLTEKQRHLLEMATRQGYFDVPRRIGLEELAAEADISHQAASELLRRAQATLNRRALGFEDSDEDASA